VSEHTIPTSHVGSPCGLGHGRREDHAPSLLAITGVVVSGGGEIQEALNDPDEESVLNRAS
jgi:hypothetical protein